MRWNYSASSHLGKVKSIQILSSSWGENYPHPLLYQRWKSFTSSHLCKVKTIHILSSGECKNHPNPLIFVRLTRSTNGEGKHNPHPCICLRGKSSTFSHLWKLKIIYILPSLWGENQPILTSGESQNHIYPLNFVRWKSSTSLWSENHPHHLIFVISNSSTSSHLV